MSTRKDCNYIENHNGGPRRFECQLCSRTVTTKFSIQRHLFTQHGLSPVQPKTKLYNYDNSIPVPKSTLYRWNSSKYRRCLAFNDCEIGDCSSSSQDKLPMLDCLDTDVSSSQADIHVSENSSCSEPVSSDDSDTDSLPSNYSASTVSSENEAVDYESSQSDAKTDALKLLSCFKKHNITSSACKDILRTIRHILPEHENKSFFNYGQLLSHIPASVYREIYYCNRCEKIFPENRLHCVSENCAGVGKTFMIANVKELLSNLLKAPSIVEDIKKMKQTAEGNVDSNILTDIHDGEMYKERLNLRNLSSEAIHLTAILNTDGVNLYSSSKVEIWPVYLAINELSPSLRFSRENILLIGLWQGRGKPPFNTFIKYISEEINLLTQHGLEIEIDEENVKVYLTVLCITLDLPAKAGVLNMTLFNGVHACITCEETGIVVKEGAGHAQSYPYRSSETRFPGRSNANVLQLMNAASDKHRQKGFKGISGLNSLHEFDIVNGSVPDYMHCILLGIVKTIMSKWFSPTQSGKDYFIGKHLKQVSERLVKIKPPYYIERLPRDLEKHYSHFKATELQTFLLYYALPCLHGILDDKYLQHFALLSEAIFILLGDGITEMSLHRSEQLLEKFHSQFSELYGPGSCGLNVHNACFHLPYYVKKLGPIWCWSCFAFEDANSAILQSVHGTGDVTKQALRNQEISIYIRSLKDVRADSSMLKVTYVAQNCDVFGSLELFRNEIPVDLMQTLGVENNGSLRKALRICVNGQRFYSEDYSRMRRRNCHTVVYSEDQFGLIQCFVLVLHTNLVYAMVKKINIVHDSWLYTYEAGKQLKAVVVTNNVDVVSVENLKVTLLFIEFDNAGQAFVVNTPNRHRHSIFK